MPNIAAVLKEEISRLARKESRQQIDALRKASAQYRRDIALLKRQIVGLQRKIATVQKQEVRATSAPVEGNETDSLRFTAKGLRSQRSRLGLSAANYAKLIGVTGQTVYSWERGTSRPRKQQIERIAALRSIGKKEALTRLGPLRRRGRQKSE